MIDFWMVYGAAIASCFLIAALSVGIRVWRDRSARLADRQREANQVFDDLAASIRAERARWHPLFRYGCHEYEQHEDGRRRAVRIVDGADVLMTEWLQVGANVPSYLAKVGQ